MSLPLCDIGEIATPRNATPGYSAAIAGAKASLKIGAATLDR